MKYYLSLEVQFAILSLYLLIIGFPILFWSEIINCNTIIGYLQMFGSQMLLSTAVKKLLVDQMCFAPCFLGSFITVNNILQGKSLDEIENQLRSVFILLNFLTGMFNIETTSITVWITWVNLVAAWAQFFRITHPKWVQYCRPTMSTFLIDIYGFVLKDEWCR